MAVKPWKQPVVVQAGKRGNVRWTVGHVAKAAEVLLYHWPQKPGPMHLKAREVMVDCLEGKCDGEEARAAFVAAAEEADILVG